MRPGTKGLMPLNRDWMDVARYLDGGIHPTGPGGAGDRLVAACEMQRLQLLAWTAALRGAARAANAARGKVRKGVTGVKTAVKESAELQATIALHRAAAARLDYERHAVFETGKPHRIHPRQLRRDRRENGLPRKECLPDASDAG